MSKAAQDKDNLFPSNIVLETYDQHSRWFLTSLVTSVALTGSTPFQALKTQGLIVDEQGEPINYSVEEKFNPVDFIEGTVKQSGER